MRTAYNTQQAATMSLMFCSLAGCAGSCRALSWIGGTKRRRCFSRASSMCVERWRRRPGSRHVCVCVCLSVCASACLRLRLRLCLFLFVYVNKSLNLDLIVSYIYILMKFTGFGFKTVPCSRVTDVVHSPSDLCPHATRTIHPLHPVN